MSEPIPPMPDVRALLRRLSMKQIAQVALDSGVPRHTIYKIRIGETKNPGVETLRGFIHHAQRVADAAPTPVKQG